MKLIYPYILLFLVLSSCYKIDRPEKPMDLISKDKMIAVLVDISLMNSAKSVNKKIIEENGVIPDQYIYKTHGIDSITFAKSNNYYAYEISEYEEIYTKVKDSLDKLKKKYKAIETKEKEEEKIKDSINKAKKGASKQVQKIKKVNKKKSLNRVR